MKVARSVPRGVRGGDPAHLPDNFRKYNGKLIIKPSRGSVNAFLAETHKVILEQGKGLTQEQLIRVLQPKVRGFAAYHRHVCSSKAFNRIAHLMWQQLWRWACRRHPNKGKRWVHDRYFRTVGGDNHVFATQDLCLAPTTWQHIVRHPQVKSDMNPYIDREYFERRRKALRARGSKSFHMPASPAEASRA